MQQRKLSFNVITFYAVPTSVVNMETCAMADAECAEACGTTDTLHTLVKYTFYDIDVFKVIHGLTLCPLITLWHTRTSVLRKCFVRS